MTDRTPYTVTQYNFSSLVEIVKQVCHPIRFDSPKFNVGSYLESYLSEIGAATIVVENNYIDRDYLEDFAAYYVRCFVSYDKTCRRLHFFDLHFEESDFTDLLNNRKSNLTRKKIAVSYLGFMVIKPLPQTRMGRTCLKNINQKDARSQFFITKTYTASLFGIPLNIESLAFQEQDKVISACATSALWSAFHFTGTLFQHNIPSPVSITKSALQNLDIETRHFPNKGLSAAQMCQSIRDIGLDPLLLHFAPNENDNFDFFRITLYSYIKGKIPVILGVLLQEIEHVAESNSFKIVKELGKHAVTVNGFSLSETTSNREYKGFMLEALRMDKIYVHDDQVAPFAKMSFESLAIDDNSTPMSVMSTCWKQDGDRRVVAVQDIILIPAYHKIRISFDTIFEIIVPFDRFLQQLRLELSQIFEALELEDNFVWDIYLTTANDIKENILKINIGLLDKDERLNLLTSSMPRFVWYASATHKGSKVLDILFDATQIEQGELIICPIEYNKNLSSFLRTFAKTYNKHDNLVIHWFANH